MCMQAKELKITANMTIIMDYITSLHAPDLLKLNTKLDRNVDHLSVSDIPSFRIILIYAFFAHFIKEYIFSNAARTNCILSVRSGFHC